MKTVITLSLLLFLTTPAFGELTKEDLRTVIKEEVRPIIKEEIAASEKRTREHIDLKIETVNARIDGLDKSLNARIDAVDQKLTARIDGLDKSLNARIDGLDKSLNARIDDIRIVMIVLIGLIAAAIAVPQIIIAYRERGQKELEKRQEDLQTEIRQLRAQIEVLQTPPS